MTQLAEVLLAIGSELRNEVVVDNIDTKPKWGVSQALGPIEINSKKTFKLALTRYTKPLAENVFGMPNAQVEII